MSKNVDTSVGPSFCLHNNIWNTNYPDWLPFEKKLGSNLAFRFTLELYPAAVPSSIYNQQWSTPMEQVQYMKRAVQLAKESVVLGAAPYGALIVNPRTKRIIAEGLNHATKNPIWHGEMAAISNFSSSLPDGTSVYDVASYHEIYTTAEPCPMCMGAIDWSGFGRVYYGTSIPFIEEHAGKQINLRASIVAAAGFTNVTVFGGILSNVTNLLYMQNEVKGIRGSDYHHRHHQEQMDIFFKDLFEKLRKNII